MRLDFDELVTRAQANTSATRVGKSTERDYVEAFTKETPGVWIMAQRQTPLSDGKAAMGRPRQRMRTEILIRCILPRYTPGEYDREDPVRTLVNEVIDTFYAWKPTGADQPLTVAGITDGAADESFITVDILLETEVIKYG